MDESSGPFSVPGACDTHMHFYDGRFPASPEALLHPPDAGLSDYSRVRAEAGLERVVVVQPTTYGLDNRCQIEAASELGSEARLVVVVDSGVTDSALAELHSLGARGARFHMLPGGAVPWSMLADVARRIEPFGWHIQLQLDGRELAARLSELESLAVPLVVDHVGRFMPPVGPDHVSFAALLRLIDGGRCWVKLSAPYESGGDGPPDYADVARLARALVAAAPERMLWATNWPHPGQDDPPTISELIDLFRTWVPDPALRARILATNPAELYGF